LNKTKRQAWKKHRKTQKKMKLARKASNR